MIMNLETKIQYLSGVGPKIAAKFERLGIENIGDLIFYYPRRYRDFTKITPIVEVAEKRRNGEAGEITISGTVLAIDNKKTRRRGFTVTEAQVSDETGLLKVVWFNQPYLVKMLRAGSHVILNGKVAYDFYSGGLAMESPTRATHPCIVPVYGETNGLTSYFIIRLMSKITSLIRNIPEFLPPEFLCHSKLDLESRNTGLDPRLRGDDKCLRLLGINEALVSIHQPENSEALAEAQRRLAFDELFLIALQSALTKAEIKKTKAPKITADIEKIKKFIATLPFTLTDDQKKAVWQIVKDMEKPEPMSRLLNGDVGSGKTIVAALAAFIVKEAGHKTLLMAPTSILANQHYETFCKLFCGMDFSIGLVTADRQEYRISNKESRKIQDSKFQILNSDVVVGTHALISGGREFENVGLVIVDEQHRFGVRQREALTRVNLLISGSVNSDFDTSQRINESMNHLHPHFLSMTATPIPRTLHLALFGELDISVINEKPANRKEIKTRLVEAGNRQKAYDFIRLQIKAGRQAFIVCPLIESNEEQGTRNELSENERKAVTTEFEKLKNIFPEFEIAMLHGRMKAKEKDAVMADFSAGKTQILVSTSVVEVGVDVPNASVMVIENAERFGLAQIHQFRGRVGRAEHQSFCFLFSDSQSPSTIKRLKALEATSDGFELAEIDLETRGPGAVFGTDQSGLLELKMASISDRVLLAEASQSAHNIMPEIDKYPALKSKIAEFRSGKHLE